MAISKLLESSVIVNTYEILEFVSSASIYFVKAKAILNDKTELHIREYFDGGIVYYSYHWQMMDGELIAGWDNAPHYKNIETFPHHKHTMNSIRPSFETTLQDVLKFIKKEIKS